MKKYRILFLVALVLMVTITVLIGCTMSESLVPSNPEEYVAAGYRRVDLYYNGGQESGSLSVEYYVRVAKANEPDVILGGRMPQPGSSGDVKQPTRVGFQFVSWYEISPDMLKTRDELQYDGNGRPVLDSRGNHATRTIPYIEGHDYLDESKNEELLNYRDYEKEQEEGYPEEDKIFIKEWNFAFDLFTEDTCLVALWNPIRKYVYVPPANKNDNFDEAGYDALPLHDIDKTGGIQLAHATNHPTSEGEKIEGFYSNREATKRISTSERYYPAVEYVDEDKTIYKVVPIYIKWLPSRFELVDSASSLERMTERGSYYIRGDLDFSGVKNFTPTNFSGEIRGNGYVWKNLTITINQLPPSAEDNTYGAIFKDLKGARIRDIKFENLNIVFNRINPTDVNDINKWSLPLTVNLFAKSIDENCVIRNVKIGDDENPVGTYREVDYSTSEVALITRVKMDNGHPVLVDTRGQDVSWVGDELTGGYPPEGTIRQDKGGVDYVLEYEWDEYNNRYKEAEVAVVDTDSRLVYGYRRLAAPEDNSELAESLGEAFEGYVFRTNILWGQTNATNFDIKNNEDEHVSGCTIKLTKASSEFEWEFVYDGTKQPLTPKTPPNNRNTEYEFAGWYTSDYELYTFPADPAEPEYLIALWKAKQK